MSRLREEGREIRKEELLRLDRAALQRECKRLKRQKKISCVGKNHEILERVLESEAPMYNNAFLRSVLRKGIRKLNGVISLRRMQPVDRGSHTKTVYVVGEVHGRRRCKSMYGEKEYDYMPFYQEVVEEGRVFVDLFIEQDPAYGSYERGREAGEVAGSHINELRLLFHDCVRRDKRKCEYKDRARIHWSDPSELKNQPEWMTDLNRFVRVAAKKKKSEEDRRKQYEWRQFYPELSSFLEEDTVEEFFKVVSENPAVKKQVAKSSVTMEFLREHFLHIMKERQDNMKGVFPDTEEVRKMICSEILFDSQRFCVEAYAIARMHRRFEGGEACENVIFHAGEFHARNMHRMLFHMGLRTVAGRRDDDADCLDVSGIVGGHGLGAFGEQREYEIQQASREEAMEGVLKEMRNPDGTLVKRDDTVVRRAGDGLYYDQVTFPGEWGKGVDERKVGREELGKMRARIREEERERMGDAIREEEREGLTATEVEEAVMKRVYHFMMLHVISRRPIPYRLKKKLLSGFHAFLEVQKVSEDWFMEFVILLPDDAFERLIRNVDRFLNCFTGFGFMGNRARWVVSCLEKEASTRWVKTKKEEKIDYKGTMRANKQKVKEMVERVKEVVRGSRYDEEEKVYEVDAASHFRAREAIKEIVRRDTVLEVDGDCYETAPLPRNNGRIMFDAVMGTNAYKYALLSDKLRTLRLVKAVMGDIVDLR